MLMPVTIMIHLKSGHTVRIGSGLWMDICVDYIVSILTSVVASENKVFVSLSQAFARWLRDFILGIYSQVRCKCPTKIGFDSSYQLKITSFLSLLYGR